MFIFIIWFMSYGFCYVIDFDFAAVSIFISAAVIQMHADALLSFLHPWHIIQKSTLALDTVIAILFRKLYTVIAVIFIIILTLKTSWYSSWRNNNEYLQHKILSWMDTFFDEFVLYYLLILTNMVVACHSKQKTCYWSLIKL